MLVDYSFDSKWYWKTYNTICLFFLFIGFVNSQQFLQIEMKNSSSSKKFALGTPITIKTDKIQEWWTITPKRFDYQNELIIYENGYISLDEIKMILTHRRTVKAIGTKLQQLGVAFGLFNTVQTIRDGFSPGGYILGGALVGTGWLFKKIFYKRKYKIGSRYKLRLLDLRLD